MPRSKLTKAERDARDSVRSDGVTFIALNDNPGDNEPVAEVMNYMTVVMLSELTGISTRTLARQVIAHRAWLATKPYDRPTSREQFIANHEAKITE